MRARIVQVFGAVGQIQEDAAIRRRPEQKMKEVAKHYEDKYKEANDVLKLRNTEKSKLLEEKEEIKKARKELEQQVQELSQGKEELEGRMCKMVEVNEFWSAKGAEKIVGTCLRSPEMYQWLLRFGGTIMNIGKTQGATAVFTKYSDDVEYWKGKKVEEVPGCARGKRYAGTYIDDKIKMLQAGRVRFQFLEYLAANPGLDCHELENLGYYAHRTLADGAVASSSTATMAAAKRMDFEDQGAAEPAGMDAGVQEGPGTEDVGERTVEKKAVTEEDVEGPGDAGEK